MEQPIGSHTIDLSREPDPGTNGPPLAREAQYPASRPRSLDLLSVTMTVTVIWNLYGFAANFFERAWAGAPIPVTAISYLLNAALIVVLPLSRSGKKWSVVTSTVLGVLMALWSAGGTALLSADVGLPPGLPTVAGPGVPAVLGALIAIFGAQAYRRLSDRPAAFPAQAENTSGALAPVDQGRTTQNQLTSADSTV